MRAVLKRFTRDPVSAIDVPFVGPKDLNSWVREEFKLIMTFIKCVTKYEIINSEGNTFSQGLSNCTAFKKQAQVRGT